MTALAVIENTATSVETVVAELARFEAWIADAPTLQVQEAFAWLRDVRALMKVRETASGLRVQAARLELRTLRRLGQLAANVLANDGTEGAHAKLKARKVLEGLRPADRQSAISLAGMPNKEFDAMCNWVSSDLATSTQISGWRYFNNQQQKRLAARTGVLRHPDPRAAGIEAAHYLQATPQFGEPWEDAVIRILDQIEIGTDSTPVIRAAKKLRQLLGEEADDTLVETAAEALAAVEEEALAEPVLAACSCPAGRHPKWVVYPDDGWVRVKWEDAGVDQFAAMVAYQQEIHRRRGERVNELVALLAGMRIAQQDTDLTYCRFLSCLAASVSDVPPPQPEVPGGGTSGGTS